MMISPRLSLTFRTQTNDKFSGLLTAPEDRLEGDELRARRILRTSRRSPVVTGSVIRGSGTSYLLFEHSRTLDEVRFLAYQITNKLAWSRTSEGVDPVTRMKTNQVDQQLHSGLSVVVEPTDVTSEEGFERPRYVVRAPGKILVGDRLGDMTVHSARHVGGASILGAV